MTLEEFVQEESQKLADFLSWYVVGREFDGYTDEYGIENWPLSQQKHEWIMNFKAFKAGKR